MNKLIDCRQYLKAIKEQCKKEIKKMGLNPHLAIIQVGNNPESDKYVGMKIKHCKEVGIEVSHYNPSHSTTEDLITLIKTLNNTKCITSIIVQLPLPKHIDEFKVLNSITSIKDLDCLTTYNIGLLNRNSPYIEPCTPKGVIYLLDKQEVKLQGKRVLILGRSEIVGKPLATMLTNRDCTVTLAHSKSNITQYNLNNDYDIIVSAVGNFKNFKINNPDIILIDVGINFDEKGNMAGDFDLDNSKFKWSTPTPFGTGTLTTSMVIKNCLELSEYQQLNNK